MPSTASATTLPWAWRLFRAADSDDERFLIAFLQAQSQGASTQDWSCDEVARTEDEARAYALQFGVSPSNFTTALEHLRATRRGARAMPSKRLNTAQPPSA